MAAFEISSIPPPPPPLPALTPQPSPKKEKSNKASQSQLTPKKEEPKKTSEPQAKPQAQNERPHQSGASGSRPESVAEEGHSKEENDFLNQSDIEAIKSAVRRVSIAFLTVLGLDVNSYATKKSLAQGILDLALLAANASQLKFILTVGKEHEFYDIILWLVVSSIILQAIQAVLCVVLALVLNLNNVDEQKKANIVNNVGLSIVILIVIVNVIICGFDIKSSNSYFYMIKQNSS